MVKETGHKYRDDNHSEEELRVAHSRLAELQAKMAKISDSKHSLKTKVERNSDLKLESWQKDSAQSEKQPKQLKRRSTRK